jgi:hypothetical protein
MLVLVLVAAAGIALAGRGCVLDLHLQRRRALLLHAPALGIMLLVSVLGGLVAGSWEVLGFAGVCALVAGVALGRSCYLAAGGAAVSLWLASTAWGGGPWLAAALAVGALGIAATALLVRLRPARDGLRRYALVPLAAERS